MNRFRIPDLSLIHIFLPIREPGTVIGHLKKEIREQVGLDCEIVLPATHDTGSAVVAVPSNEEHVLYISSGTWSLMGLSLIHIWFLCF